MQAGCTGLNCCVRRRRACVARRVRPCRCCFPQPRAGQAGDQPRAALEGDVAPCPVQRDDRPPAETDQEVDVGGAPQHPGDETRQAHLAEVGHRILAADRGERAEVAIAERRQRFAARTRDQLASPDTGPAAWRPAQRPAAAFRLRRVRAPCRRARRCPDAPARDRSGSTMTRPARSAGTRQPVGGRRRLDARRPHDRAGLDPLVADRDVRSLHDVTIAFSRTSTPSFSSDCRAFSDSDGWSAGKQPRAALDEDDARAARIDVAEVARPAPISPVRRSRRPFRRRSARRR